MLADKPRDREELLSVRISAALLDRMRNYVKAERLNIKDFVAETLEARLDALDPAGKEQRLALERAAAEAAKVPPASEERLDRLEDALRDMRAMLQAAVHGSAKPRKHGRAG